MSIVIPVLNEAQTLPHALRALLPLRVRGVEVIIVDGGSEDGSTEMVRQAELCLLSASPSRARQMNAGARVATSEALVFLHADCELPEDADRLIENALGDPAHIWGRFDVCIEGRSRVLNIVATLMNWRSRLTGIATGDQAVFVRRGVFQAIGGFPDQPLMEDIELSKRLRALAQPVCIRARVITSGRRWESRGVWRTIFLMWRLRWAYWRGVPASVLANAYR